MRLYFLYEVMTMADVNANYVNLEKQRKKNNTYFNEYVFYRCVRNRNSQLKRENSAPLTAQEVSQLRETFKTELLGALEADGKNVSAQKDWSASDVLRKVRPNLCVATLSRMFATNGKELFRNYDYVNDPNMRLIIDAFSKNTGLTAKSTMRGSNIDYIWNSFISNKNRLPVSPYDDRFAGRNQNEITWVNVNDGRFRVDNIVTLTNDVQTVNRACGTSSQEEQQVQNNSTENKDILDVLQPYMTAAEYGNIRPYFDKDMHGNALTEIPHAETAVAVLDYLRNNGIEYKLQPDIYNGQIKCRLTDTKIDIRLVDVSDLQNKSDQYVGRVYEDGVSYYYKDMRATSKENRKEFRPDARQVIDLIRYVRGESVARFDGKGHIGDVVTRNNNRYNGTYWAAKTSTVNGRSSSGFTSYAGVYNGVEFGIQKMGDETPSAIVDETTSISYLDGAVNSARNNFKDEIEIDNLVEMAKVHANDEDYEYPFSANMQIRTLQREYFNFLTGKTSVITMPDGTRIDRADIGDTIDDNMISAIDKHADATVDDLIGKWGENETFNPANTAEFMSSEYGIYHNNDELVRALRILDYPPERLKGANNNFYNKTFVDKLIKFDADSATPMKNKSPFMNSMFDKIKTTLEETGCVVKDSDILIDKNGIVQYKAVQAASLVRGKNSRVINGQIGQIFEPDGKGLVETKFFGRGDDNYLFVPGYEAYVVPQKDGEDLSMEERTRLVGYEQLMRDTIGHQIRRDVMIPSSPLGTGSPTNLNNTYSRLYVERFPLNYMDYMRNTVEQAQLTDARIETLSRRVRYSNELRDGSTINAEYRDKHGLTDKDNSKRDPYKLTGTNMSLISESSNGYFDPEATSTSVNQGVVRYLVESAKVNADGSIIKGDENDRTPLLKMDMCKYMTEYNAGDRVTMTFNNLLSGLDVGPAKTACMSFGGWTFDDGYVISKRFAEKRTLPNASGVGRPLKTGDKISDLNGNKGVISAVVDPDMPLEESEKRGMTEMVKWFKANPDLEVVGAPYAGVSRFNGGSAREAIANHSDLQTPDGNIKKGCMGTMYFLTSNMVVDEKTHMYGIEEEMVGKGRKVSGQAGWVLQSKDARNIAKEFFGPNDRALMSTREMLVTLGLDVNELGELQPEYVPHNGEKRKVFELPKVEDTISEYAVKSKGSDEEHTVHRRDRKKFNSREEFMRTVGRAGGILELPFPLKLATGNITPPLNDGKTDVIYSKQEWERKGYTRKDGVYVKPTIVHRHADANVSRNTDKETYGLPIMSATLRSGQEFADDGISTVHDYTREYMKIYESALNYQLMQYRIDNKEYDNIYPNENALTKKQEELQGDAQSSYSVIANDLKRRKFEGKHNIARDELMARRLPKSATAVWTANPSLDLNEVAMSSSMADMLGVKPDGKKDEYVLIWRDPLLRDAGMRYLKVTIDDNLTGIAVNPVVDKSFDGDFDGDTVAVVALQTEKAKNEAYRKFSMEANMLDLGSKDKTGMYKLAYHVDGLDLAGPMAADETLAKRQAAVQKKANEIYMNENMSESEKLHINRQLLDYQSDLTYEVFNKSYGKHMLSFNNLTDHMQSLEQMVHDGAKGSMKKLGDYATYIGADLTMTFERDHIAKVDDLVHTAATRDDIVNTQVATSVKALGTGIAGSFSQRAVVAFRNQCMKSALEVTYPVTQAVLQSKHDPAEARQKYNLMMGPVRHLWRGHKLEESYDPVDGMTWTPVKENGEYVQVTPKEFKQQFTDIYTSSNGLNVAINPDCVDEITKVLTNPDTGKIMDVEGEARDKYACTLDRLAYGGTFDTWVEMAKDETKRDIFNQNSLFTPSKVRRNRMKIENGLGKESLQPIMKQDVMDKSMLTAKKNQLDEKPVVDDKKPVSKSDIKALENKIQNTGLNTADSCDKSFDAGA